MSDKRTRGRPRDPANTQAILRAAEHLLRDQGYAAASMEAIAREAGVAKQTIYRWWPRKADVFLSLLSERAAQATPLADTGNLQQDLEELLTKTFDTITRTLHPLMRALLVEGLQDADFAATLRTQFVERRRDNVRTLIERERIRRAHRDKLDIELLCDMVFGTLWYRFIFAHAPLDSHAAKSLSMYASQLVYRSFSDI